MIFIKNKHIHRIMLNIMLTITGLYCPSALASMDTQSKQSTDMSIDKIEFRQATTEDVNGIVQLMDNADADKNKIVILPKMFRALVAANDVSKGHFFVAACSNNKIATKNGTSSDEHITTPCKYEQNVIAFTKLFCITTQEKLNQILNDELRSHQPPADITQVTISGDDTMAATSSMSASSTLDPLHILSSLHTTYVYKGADYTHPDHRGQGINHHLTTFAFNHLLSDVVDQITERKSSALALAYGLTAANAGDHALDGRARNIIKQFMPFAQQVCQKIGCTAPIECLISRYQAYMPTFDPNATECKQLPDKHSVPGYGNLLTCKLK